MECKTCEHFQPVGDNGDCHRFPPQNDGKGSSTIDEFPQVRSTFWCGEYKRKDKK